MFLRCCRGVSLRNILGRNLGKLLKSNPERTLSKFSAIVSSILLKISLGVLPGYSLRVTLEISTKVPPRIS